MGIPELRFSLPISWAHWARSFSNCTSLRSRSSIFLRHSAISIGFLPKSAVFRRKSFTTEDTEHTEKYFLDTQTPWISVCSVVDLRNSQQLRASAAPVSDAKNSDT